MVLQTESAVTVVVLEHLVLIIQYLQVFLKKAKYYHLCFAPDDSFDYVTPKPGVLTPEFQALASWDRIQVSFRINLKVP